MIVSFYSVDEELNKISYKSDAKRINNSIIFEDKSTKDTIINLEIYDDKIIIDRSGFVNTYFEFRLNETFETKYKSGDGLEFEFKIFCNLLEIKQNRIDIEYDMILDESTTFHHKIWLLLRENT
jgi:uncharacterized beta-barrel protein YwiB (DUF1934 family)